MMFTLHQRRPAMLEQHLHELAFIASQFQLAWDAEVVRQGRHGSSDFSASNSFAGNWRSGGAN